MFLPPNLYESIITNNNKPFQSCFGILESSAYEIQPYLNTKFYKTNIAKKACHWEKPSGKTFHKKKEAFVCESSHPNQYICVFEGQIFVDGVKVS